MSEDPDPARRIVSESDLQRLHVRVQDPAAHPIHGAQVRDLGDSGVLLGVTDGTGNVDIDARRMAGKILETRAAGFVPERCEPVTGPGPVVITLFPACGAQLLIVDSEGVPVSGVVVTLAPRGTTVLDGGIRRRGRSGPSGVVRLDGLVAGRYRVSVKSKDVVLAGLTTLEGADGPILAVPCPHATLKLEFPSVAWMEPEAGKIVTGYFMVPFTRFDTGQATRDVFRTIRSRLTEQRPRSRASVFLARRDAVQFGGYLERGGWTRVRVPVVKWGRRMVPFVYHTVDKKRAKTARIVVTARDRSGQKLDDVPFYLRPARPSALGVFSFPFHSGVPLTVPVGKYTFGTLQGGVARLFEWPKEAVDLASGVGAGLTKVELRALVPVRRVAVLATRRTDSVQKELHRTITIEDRAGFATQFASDGTAVQLWLPIGRTLLARARRQVAGRAVEFEAEFEVPKEGGLPLCLRFRRR